MKSFVNRRDTIVVEAIDGFLMSSAAVDLCRLDDFPDVKVVLRSDWDRSRVALVSGGGSGHEPAHVGFVGAGMLTAAVCGELFASPSVDAVLAGIVAVTGEAGCLLIVKNYTGDRLNFGLAAERARAMGLRVELVIVADDVALPGARHPRGIAGTLFVHKLAGAAAEAGLPLAEVKAIAQAAADNTKSLGLALSTCMMPGAEERRPGEVSGAELGLGIHGEAGAKVVPFAPADPLIALLADTLEEAVGPGATRLALLVNGLGGVPPLELSVVMKAVAGTSLMRRVEVVIGPAPLMTAIDMHGVSLSVLTLTDDRLRLLEAPAAPAAWPRPKRFAAPRLQAAPDLGAGSKPAPSERASTRAVLMRMLDVVQAMRSDIDALDARSGDGDTGSTFAGAARAISAQADALPFADGAGLLRVLSDVLLRSAGGSSGVLLATFSAAASTAYAREPSWPRALQAGLARLKALGGAEMGDRTMIDALEPALEALAKGGGLVAAARAARAGADATIRMGRAQAGRASYVPPENLLGHADPGAEAVARVFEALSLPA